MSESSGRAGAPWALWGLVVASVLLPLLVFAGGGWLAWRGTVRDANASLSSALAVSEEQATRVFDTHVLLGGRVNDLLGDLDDDAVIARERELHDRLAAMIAGYSQVTAILVTGADGRALVATSRFPADHRVSFSDRGYFIALRDGDAPFQIGGVVHGRVTRADVFTVAVRRGGTGKDFGGAILVGVSPSYFSRFDSELFGGDTDYTALLLREDGTPLAGYPEPPPAEASQRDRWLADVIAHRPQGGLVRGISSVDGIERVIAYRRLTNYPVYVTTGRRWSSVVGEWRDDMATHLIFGIPATLGLLALSLLAMRQWRRQHETLARLRDEVRRREVAEEALRQSQKMEAVGRLTGGIAHDFNNHLTVISSNIELLQRRLPPDSGSLTRLTDAAMAGVQRAATLTHRLLAFSRQQPLEPEPIDVSRLVSNMSDLLRRTLGEHIAIETVLAGGLWQTRVDANQLENVLLNLAVNARDAMPTRRQDDDRDGEYVARRGLCRVARRGDGGTVCDARGHRYRHRHDARGDREGVRTVLHHQAARTGHRSRPVDGVRLRQAIGRPRGDLQRAGPGQHDEGLSAALRPSRDASCERDTPPRRRRVRAAAARRSWWWRTMKACAVPRSRRCATSATRCSRRAMRWRVCA